MRRFYFHVKKGQLTVLDHEGVEFADEREAVEEAARRGVEIATRSALKGISPAGIILVVDEQWQPVCGVPFDGDAERKEHVEKGWCQSGLTARDEIK